MFVARSFQSYFSALLSSVLRQSVFTLPVKCGQETWAQLEVAGSWMMKNLRTYDEWHSHNFVSRSMFMPNTSVLSFRPWIRKILLCSLPRTPRFSEYVPTDPDSIVQANVPNANFLDQSEGKFGRCCFWWWFHPSHTLFTQSNRTYVREILVYITDIQKLRLLMWYMWR